MSTQKTITFKETKIRVEKNNLTKKPIDTRDISKNTFSLEVNSNIQLNIKPQTSILVEYKIDKPNTSFYLNNYLFFAGIMSSYIYTDVGILIRLFNSNKFNSVLITPDTFVGLIKYDETK